jgi:hypothetical protein
MTAPSVRRVRRSLTAALSAGLGLLLAAPPASAGAVDMPVKTTSANEVAGGADGSWVGWSQAPSGSASFQALASDSGGSPITLNENGKVATIGGIEGDTAVFRQNDSASDWNIYRYDLDQQQRTKYGTKVNTTGKEFAPTVSGGRLLFGRVIATNTETIRVFTPSSGKTRVLDTIHATFTDSVGPGQINGKFAVWHRCAPKCNVFEWNRQTDNITKLVNGSGQNQWFAAVAPDGTAYYVREGVQCDSVAKIVEDPRNGPPHVIFTLPNDTTAAHLFVDDVGAMGRNVYYSAVHCTTPLSYDVRLLEIS